MNFIAHMFFLFDLSGSICILRTPNTFVFFGWGGESGGGSDVFSWMVW